MKTIKLFEISYFLNFILWLLFLATILYYNTNEGEVNTFAIIVFSLVFLLIIVPFNWICYSLHKTIKNNQQLLKSAKIAGSILCVLFSSLTLLETIGSINIISDGIFNKSYLEFRFIAFSSLFLLITFSSLYLCCSYWIIRKQTNKLFIDIITQLGDESIRQGC